ncbi:hypothetical protein Agub_g4526, partial [Astrephomene gubernaculifera]
MGTASSKRGRAEGSGSVRECQPAVRNSFFRRSVCSSANGDVSVYSKAPRGANAPNAVLGLRFTWLVARSSGVVNHDPESTIINVLDDAFSFKTDQLSDDGLGPATHIVLVHPSTPWLEFVKAYTAHNGEGPSKIPSSRLPGPCPGPSTTSSAPLTTSQQPTSAPHPKPVPSPYQCCCLGGSSSSAAAKADSANPTAAVTAPPAYLYFAFLTTTDNVRHQQLSSKYHRQEQQQQQQQLPSPPPQRHHQHDHAAANAPVQPVMRPASTALHPQPQRSLPFCDLSNNHSLTVLSAAITAATAKATQPAAIPSLLLIIDPAAAVFSDPDAVQALAKILPYCASAPHGDEPLRPAPLQLQQSKPCAEGACCRTTEIAAVEKRAAAADPWVVPDPYRTREGVVASALELQLASCLAAADSAPLVAAFGRLLECRTATTTATAEEAAAVPLAAARHAVSRAVLHAARLSYQRYEPLLMPYSSPCACRTNRRASFVLTASCSSVPSGGAVAHRLDDMAALPRCTMMTGPMTTGVKESSSQVTAVKGHDGAGGGGDGVQAVVFVHSQEELRRRASAKEEEEEGNGGVHIGEGAGLVNHQCRTTVPLPYGSSPSPTVTITTTTAPVATAMAATSSLAGPSAATTSGTVATTAPAAAEPAASRASSGSKSASGTAPAAAAAAAMPPYNGQLPYAAYEAARRYAALLEAAGLWAPAAAVLEACMRAAGASAAGARRGARSGQLAALAVQLGRLQGLQGLHRAAEATWQQAVEVLEALHGPRSVPAQSARVSLARTRAALASAGGAPPRHAPSSLPPAWDAAEGQLRSALAALDALLGPTAAATLAARRALAEVLAEAGSWAEAEVSYQALLTEQEDAAPAAAVGPSYPVSGSAAAVVAARDDVPSGLLDPIAWSADAAALADVVFAVQREHGGMNELYGNLHCSMAVRPGEEGGGLTSWDAAAAAEACRRNCGACISEVVTVRRLTDPGALYDRAIAVRLVVLGSAHPQVFELQLQHARYLGSAGQYDKAEAVCRTALQQLLAAGAARTADPEGPMLASEARLELLEADRDSTVAPISQPTNQKPSNHSNCHHSNHHPGLLVTAYHTLGTILLAASAAAAAAAAAAGQGSIPRLPEQQPLAAATTALSTAVRVSERLVAAGVMAPADARRVAALDALSTALWRQHEASVSSVANAAAKSESASVAATASQAAGMLGGTGTAPLAAEDGRCMGRLLDSGGSAEIAAAGRHLDGRNCCESCAVSSRSSLLTSSNSTPSSTSPAPSPHTISPALPSSSPPPPPPSPPLQQQQSSASSPFAVQAIALKRRAVQLASSSVALGEQHVRVLGGWLALGGMAEA